jgi:N-acetylglutamate synthase-like GNAT family acetyltransferase
MNAVYVGHLEIPDDAHLIYGLDAADVAPDFHIDRVFVSHNGTLIQASFGEKCIGRASLTINQDGLEFHCFIVSPAYRNRGVGEKILRKAIELARNKQLYLFATKRARSLYTRIGFEPVNNTNRMEYKEPNVLVV